MGTELGSSASTTLFMWHMPTLFQEALRGVIDSADELVLVPSSMGKRLRTSKVDPDLVLRVDGADLTQFYRDVQKVCRRAARGNLTTVCSEKCRNRILCWFLSRLRRAMGRRVLTVYELSFHEKRKHKPASFAPADLNGEDLLDVFQDWVAGLTTAETHNEDRQTWVSVADASRYAPRVLLLDLRVGAYGEAGELVDVDTGEPVGTIADNQAPTGSNRALLFVPETGERAYFLSEESSRGQAGGRIRDLFRSYFSNYTDKATMVMTAVTEGEIWAEAAKLKEVEVRVEGKSVDVADGRHVQVGKVSYVARPERQKWFPGKLLKGLKDEKILKRIVAVEDLPKDRTVWVTMEHDGRTKKFELGTEGAPAIRELLNQATEPTLETSELVARCTERVTGLCKRRGAAWDTSWSRPARLPRGE